MTQALPKTFVDTKEPLPPKPWTEQADFVPSAVPPAVPSAVPSWGTRVFLLLAVLMLAFSFRLSAIRTTGPNPDEAHWVLRAGTMLDRINEGHPENITSHLGHPGIPAAAIMALGQEVASLWNAALHVEPYSKWYIDALAASRFANALFSSLIFVVLLFSSYRLIGFSAVMLATVLLALDCQHISLTRIAHIDGALTLLATSCLLLGYYAERSRSIWAKLAAGLLWGMAVATKPTAVTLLGCFFAYKVFRRWYCSRYLENPPPLLEWSDIWAVVVGHAFLGVTYTKLWNPNNTYVTKHLIDPPFVGWVNSANATLLASPLFLSALLGVTALCLLRLRSLKFSKLEFHLLNLLTLASCLLLAVGFFPVTIGNFSRFWYWVAGLSNRNHEAYGMVWSPPAYGYLEIWVRRLPSLILIGLFFAIAFFLRRQRQVWNLETAERAAFLCALFAAAVIWTLPLGISAKQTTRYVVPMFPAIFLFAGWGLVQLFSSFCEYSNWRSLGRPFAGSSVAQVKGALLALIIIAQGMITRSWYPNYALYFNSLTGGIGGALSHSFVLSPLGYETALERIHQEALLSNQKQHVEVFGDLELMKYAYARMYPKESRKKVVFRRYQNGIGSRWVLAFSSFVRRGKESFGDTSRFTPEFTLQEHGATVFQLLRVVVPTFSEKEIIPVSQGARAEGVVREFASDGDVVIANPKQSGDGYINFDQYVRVHPGRYRVSYLLALLPDAKSETGVLPENRVIRLEFSTACTRTLLRSELSSFRLMEYSFECNFTAPTRAQLSAYWFGKTALRLGDMTIQRLD